MLKPLPDLELGKKMRELEAKEYVDVLYQNMHERWEQKINQGNFMREIAAGSLPMEGIRLFWQNWSYYVFEVNNIIASTYQKHIGFFKRHPDLMASFSAKVADEYIHPRPPGHVLVVLEQGKVFGLTDEDMIACEMMADCRGILEFKRGLLHEGTILEWWSSAATEEPIGHWAGKWKEALTKQYGLSLAQAEYFQLHEEADLEEHEGVMGHGDFNRGVLQRLLQTGMVDLRPGFSPQYVVDVSVDFYSLFFGGVYQAVKDKKGVAA